MAGDASRGVRCWTFRHCTWILSSSDFGPNIDHKQSQSGRPSLRGCWLKLVTAGIELRGSGYIRHATLNAQSYTPLTKGEYVTAKVVSIVERRPYQSNATSLEVGHSTWVSSYAASATITCDAEVVEYVVRWPMLPRSSCRLGDCCAIVTRKTWRLCSRLIFFCVLSMLLTKLDLGQLA